MLDENEFEFLEKSGIYAIINIYNDKHYIGSAKNFKMRRRVHFNELKRNDHANQKLQNSWNKWWHFSFIFVILEYCEPDPQILTDREQWWIDRLKPQYNIAPKANTQLGYRHSEETKTKMSLNQNRSNECRENRALGQIGLKRSKKHVQNIQNSRKGYFHSEETKNKIGEANKISQLGKKHSLESINKRKGRKRSEETKLKMKLAWIKRKENNGNRI